MQITKHICMLQQEIHAIHFSVGLLKDSVFAAELYGLQHGKALKPHLDNREILRHQSAKNRKWLSAQGVKKNPDSASDI